eukprot:m.24026 g.24026  ORF g.24026 m.24026 type:complete len:134 (+) comp35775_c0_seq2:47-448(+)
MVYTRFVQIGRVALVIAGPQKGKLVVILNVMTQTTVLVSGPETGVPRSLLKINQIALTDFVIKVPLNAGNAAVRKAWKKDDITGKWSQTAWAKKLEAKKLRAKLTDFDRFVVAVNKKKRNQFIAAKVAELNKA